MRRARRSASAASPLRVALGTLASLGAALSLVGCGGDATPTAVPSPSPSPTVAPRDPGVGPARIVVGQSAAFSGSAGELGVNMRMGIQAAFHEANEAGGIHGRTLELRSLDDAYEPARAVANTRTLIEDEGVFMLLGAVGTPTSRSAAPLAHEAGVPYIAPLTGAGFLRNPGMTSVINLRASYAQETEAMVDRLTADLGAQRIAVFYQDDSFGRSGYEGALAAMERRDLEPVAAGLYPRNTTAVKVALLDIQRVRPDAVILVGSYEPISTLILWARRIRLNTEFVNISFVGSNALAQALGPDGAGVFVTQVVPFPWDRSQNIVAAYRRTLAAYDPSSTPGFVSLEGYMAGRLAVAGLQAAGPNLTRERFLNSLRSMETVDLDGFELNYGEEDNQGSDQVFLTVIGSDGRYYPIERMGDWRP